jgi:hypothetical protein
MMLPKLILSSRRGYGKPFRAYPVNADIHCIEGHRARPFYGGE